VDKICSCRINLDRAPSKALSFACASSGGGISAIRGRDSVRVFFCATKAALEQPKDVLLKKTAGFSRLSARLPPAEHVPTRWEPHSAMLFLCATLVVAMWPPRLPPRPTKLVR
jgi:hypothetical protein